MAETSGITNFLADGATIPEGSAFKSSTSQTVLPAWYTNYAMETLAAQKALSAQPYQTYQGPRVADFNPTQQQAWDATRTAAGAYQPYVSAAGQATQDAMGQSTLNTAQPYFNRAMSFDPVAAAQPGFTAAAGGLSAAKAINPLNNAAPMYEQALNLDPSAASAGGFADANRSISMAQGTDLGAAAQPYYQSALRMNPGEAASSDFGAARGNINRALTYDSVGAAQPYFGNAAGYTQASTSPTGLNMAQPFFGKASGTVEDVSSYMNPYLDNVVNYIGDVGARNLRDKIMPELEGRYISSGQWRGSGQLTDTMRAVRDTSADILGQQAQLAQSGYLSAQGAKAGDLSRFASMAGTAGQLGQAQQNIVANAGRTFADIGSSLGGLTQAQQQAALSAANQQAGLGSAEAGFVQNQQQLTSNIGTQMGGFAQAQQAADLRAAEQQAAIAQQQAAQQQAQQTFLASMGTNIGNFAAGQQQMELSAAQQAMALGNAQAGLEQGQQGFYTGMGTTTAGLEGGDLNRYLGGAQQLATLGGLSQQYGLEGAGALSAIGQQQQTMDQANLDVGYADFLRQQGYPQTQIDAMIAAMKGIAPGVPTGASEYGIVPVGDPNYYKPSTAAQIAGGLTGAAGVIKSLGDIF